MSTISLQTSQVKAQKFAEKMLAKAKDPTAKFPNQIPNNICNSCLGTGFRKVYLKGKRFVKRCESAFWDSEKKRLVCSGNPNHFQLELENKQNLSSHIWQMIVKNQVKDQFILFLIENYQTTKLTDLMLQQVDTIAYLLHSGKLVLQLKSFHSIESTHSTKVA